MCPVKSLCKIWLPRYATFCSSARFFKIGSTCWHCLKNIRSPDSRKKWLKKFRRTWGILELLDMCDGDTHHFLSVSDRPGRGCNAAHDWPNLLVGDVLPPKNFRLIFGCVTTFSHAAGQPLWNKWRQLHVSSNSYMWITRYWIISTNFSSLIKQCFKICNLVDVKMFRNMLWKCWPTLPLFASCLNFYSAPFSPENVVEVLSCAAMFNSHSLQERCCDILRNRRDLIGTERFKNFLTGRFPSSIKNFLTRRFPADAETSGQFSSKFELRGKICYSLFEVSSQTKKFGTSDDLLLTKLHGREIVSIRSTDSSSMPRNYVGRNIWTRH